MTSTPRRTAKTGRRYDAERSKELLRDAALVEFAEKGLAGARVEEIAARAGVNKQLISHYFGGKSGLYRAIVAEEVESQVSRDGSGGSLGDLATQYLEYAHGQSARQRLAIRELLSADIGDVQHQPEDRGLQDLRERQEAGEIAAELDPAFVLLLLQSIVAAGTVFAGDVKRLTGMDPDSEEYLAHVSEQIRLLAARLA